jgi:hypothetical protein
MEGKWKSKRKDLQIEKAAQRRGGLERKLTRRARKALLSLSKGLR